VAKKKLLEIDADLRDASKKYVEAQIATIRNYGGEPRLPAGGVDELTLEVAQYPQRVRNLTRKLEAKQRRAA
jgi:hypothetical protein